MITDSKKYKSAEFVDSDEDSSDEGSEEETKERSGWSFGHSTFQCCGAIIVVLCLWAVLIGWCATSGNVEVLCDFGNNC